MKTSGGRVGAPPATHLSPAGTWIGNGTAGWVDQGLASFCAVTTGPVLLAVDRALLEHKVLAPMIDALTDAGLEPLILSDFGPELMAEQVDAAAATGRQAGVTAVIGVGGGSVLDAAKMIAVLQTNEGASADWYGVTLPPVRRSPLVLIPTTVGTGAEVTRISMITDDGEKRIASSIAFVPDLVVLDADLVASLPNFVVASTALDALAHASEALLSLQSTPLTESASLEAIELVVGNITAAYEGDAEATGRLLHAAYRAGLALNAGVVLGHSLGYAIAHEKPMAHGTTSGLALAYTIAYNQHVEPRKAELLSRALTDGRSAHLRAAAEAVKAIVQRVGQPFTLDEAGVPEGVEDEMARRTVDLYPRPTNPESMDFERVRALICAMRTGDLEAAFAVTSLKES